MAFSKFNEDDLITQITRETGKTQKRKRKKKKNKKNKKKREIINEVVDEDKVYRTTFTVYSNRPVRFEPESQETSLDQIGIITDGTVNEISTGYFY